MVLIQHPAIMGIINITPDSFYPGSRQQDIPAIVKQAEKMMKEGANFIDVGGQSTRPGSERVDVDTELSRVIPAVEAINRELPDVILSIDTFYSKVATEAVLAGASIVNDVTTGMLDDNMFAAVGKLNVPYICMHSKGPLETMHRNPSYDDVSKEVLDFLIHKISDCRAAGIHDIIVDPGFGFGKTIRHNFELLKTLSVFKMLELPMLVGISRKSTIYKTLGTTAEDALNGTTVMNTIALLNGANILRVHDVKEAREAVTLVEEYLQ